MKPNRIVLKPGREKSLQHRHPWVFSGAIERIEGTPAAGETVLVTSSDGAFLARAAYSPESQIRARAWTFDADDTVDEAFLRRRIAEAVAKRAAIFTDGTDSARLAHSESDGLPGLVADRYGNTVVLQILSAGAEHWKDVATSAFAALPGVEAVFERSDAEVRALEGLPVRTGPLIGMPPAPLVIRELGLRYEIDILAGQKTGFYLDQRDNRALTTTLAEGAEVLNAFCFTGGFTLNALLGGAKHVLSLDTSEEALALARRNVAANGLDAGRAEFVEADVFAHLRELRNRGRSFDLIVLDPPKFAPTEKHVPKAARAYKDINLWAMKMLRPGGRLLTFSCSGAVGPDLFQKIVAGAAVDAKAELVIERRLTGAPDHPVSIHFPEGEYLKGLLLRKER